MVEKAHLHIKHDTQFTHIEEVVLFSLLRIRSEVSAVTTHTVPGYRVVKGYGVVHGLTARTRGLSGKIVGSLHNRKKRVLQFFSTTF